MSLLFPLEREGLPSSRPAPPRTCPPGSGGRWRPAAARARPPQRPPRAQVLPRLRAASAGPGFLSPERAALGAFPVLPSIGRASRGAAFSQGACSRRFRVFRLKRVTDWERELPSGRLCERRQSRTLPRHPASEPAPALHLGSRSSWSQLPIIL